MRGGSTSPRLLDDDDDDEYASDVDHGLTGEGQELENVELLRIRGISSLTGVLECFVTR